LARQNQMGARRSRRQRRSPSPGWLFLPTKCDTLPERWSVVMPPSVPAPDGVLGGEFGWEYQTREWYGSQGLFSHLSASVSYTGGGPFAAVGARKGTSIALGRGSRAMMRQSSARRCQPRGRDNWACGCSQPGSSRSHSS
jgi:hypothetical protein